MKKKVIALYGSSQEGKSTVLRNVIKYFKPEMELSDDQDYCIAVNVNNKLVGISTAGDDFNIYHSLCELKEMKCELFITASRTKGSSCNAIYQFVEENFKKDKSEDLNDYILWIKKSKLDNQICSNESDSFKEFNRIESLYLIQYIQSLLLN